MNKHLKLLKEGIDYDVKRYETEYKKAVEAIQETPGQLY